MYTKLFEKIVDSSIWLESAPTCKVWITLLATKKSDQIARYGSIENLSRRAGLSVGETEEAVRILESPDPHRPDQEFEGRRIERVPDGWFIINGEKYQGLKTAEELRERDRERLRRWRESKRTTKRFETDGNALKPPVDIDIDVQETKTPTVVPKPSRGKAEAQAVEYPPPLDTDPFKAAFASWTQHRRELGKKLTPTTRGRQLKFLAGLGEAGAIASLEQSIEKGWTGLFEPKNAAPASSQIPNDAADSDADTVYNILERMDRDRPELREAGLRLIRESKELVS